MTTRLIAFLVLALVAKGTHACPQEPIHLGPNLATRDFVSGEEIASDEWEALPIDEGCRETILVNLRHGSVHSSASEPVVPRVAAEGRAETISTLQAIEPASEILVGTILQVAPGYSCHRSTITRRIDIEIEEVMRGTYKVGEQISILEEGGWFDAGGVRLLRAESSYYPAAAVGDRMLVAGFGRFPGALTAFPELIRFRLQGDVVEPAGAPIVTDREPQSLARLRALLEPEK